MHQKTRFLLIVFLSLFTIIGLLILLLVTTTPRSVDYTFSKIGTPSHATSEYLCNVQIPEKKECVSLYDVLQSFSLIYEDDELESSSNDYYPYNFLNQHVGNLREIEAIMLYQVIPPEVESTKEYLEYQNTEERLLYFVESEHYTDENVINAYNYNLRSRQTAIIIFCESNRCTVAYVLNNVWMRPRRYTQINMLLNTCCYPFLIADLDGNLSKV